MSEKEEVLGIGEVKVFNRPVVMTCYGLGSCIGLFIKDRSTGISGGAHVFLPENYAGYHSSNAISLVNTMLGKMKLMGSDLTNLRAKLVGGANVLRFGENTIGAQNFYSVKEQLISNKVYIAAIDIGGKQGRTARFDVSTESLAVKILETKQVNII
jgi:chemotaxis protein CheD